MRKLFLALAAILLLAVVAAPSATAVGTLAGTAISNQAYVDYKDANGNAMTRVYSNTVTTTVTQVAGVDTSPATGATNGIPGTDVPHAVTVCNIGNGSDTISLAAVSDKGWTVRIYKDDDGDGIWDPTELTLVTSTGVLAADTCIQCNSGRDRSRRSCRWNHCHDDADRHFDI